MNTKLCERCKRRIKADAISCICGWGVSPQRAPTVSCCYAECFDQATVRVWTKTGWANVCVEHYRRVESVPRRSESLVVQKIREAYGRSYDAHKRADKPWMPKQRAA